MKEHPLSEFAKYTVTVSGSPQVFYIDDSANPLLTFEAGKTYVFDQSDPTNATHPIVFGPVADVSTTIGTDILGPDQGVTMVGTPGQPGAYTQLDLSGDYNGYLTYYCYNHSGMGHSK